MSTAVPAGHYQAIQIASLQSTMAAGIEALQLATLPRRELEPEEVRVKVHASALNYFDLLMLQGRYQYRPPLPFTAGSEASGTVLEVGPGVHHWRAGDAVILGMSMGDALASELVTHQDRLCKKPPQMTHAEAAALPVGFFTAYHALVHRGKVQRGEILLVTGAGGGMGLSAIQLGVQLGLTVIGAASSAEKCLAAKRAGAHFTVNYSKLHTLKSKVSQITGGRFADVIYEVVGGAVFSECVRCVASNGRLLVVGFASGDIPAVPVNLILVKGFSLVGVRSGQEMLEQPELALQMREALNAVADEGHSRALAPVVDTRPLQRFRQLFELLMNREMIGKGVLLWLPEDKAAHSKQVAEAQARPMLTPSPSPSPQPPTGEQKGARARL